MVTKVVRPATSSCLGVVPCDFSLKNLSRIGVICSSPKTQSIIQTAPIQDSI